ncbi:hypothetical protein MKK68_15820 [Methylobacterium sp. E-016]|nr:hypothetical protein [Methylobacterium sp. E-016]
MTVISNEESMNKHKEIMGNIVDREAHQLQERLVAEVQKVAATIDRARVIGSADGWKSKSGGLKNANKKFG